MRVRISIVLAALLVPLLLPGAVGARSAQAAVRAADAAVLAYWTPERIANAKWRDYVRNDAGKLVPNPGKPPSGGGGNVTGASWPNAGAIQQRSGRILFSSGGSDWICSGSVADDGQAAANGYSLILTAGHCVFDGTDGWSYNFLYMPNFDAEPNYDCAARQLGCWRATRLAANTTFVTGGGFGTNATVAVDYGFARVGLRLNGSTEVDQLYGRYSIKTTSTSSSATQWAFGYPAEGRYKGKDFTYCKGPTISDPNGANTWGVACNMNGGSSGGPWLADASANPADGSGVLSSVNSYGYSGLTYMFGPKLNSTTVAVGAAAISGNAGGSSRICNVGTTQPSC